MVLLLLYYFEKEYIIKVCQSTNELTSSKGNWSITSHCIPSLYLCIVNVGQGKGTVPSVVTEDFPNLERLFFDFSETHLSPRDELQVYDWTYLDIGLYSVFNPIPLLDRSEWQFGDSTK